MIASCPQCNSRYRIAREKIGAAGARIRCSRCDTIFRVEAPGPRSEQETPTPAVENLNAPPPAPAAAPQASTPQPPQPAPAPVPPVPEAPQQVVAPEPPPAASPPQPEVPRPNVLVAEADAEMAKSIAEMLDAWGLDCTLVSSGAEALLHSFRNEFALTIFGGHLPGVSAPVLTEVMRRSSERREAKLVRVAPMDEPAGAPEFEANHMLEPGDLPAGLSAILEQMGIGTRPKAQLAEAPSPNPAPSPMPSQEASPVAPPPSAPAPAEAPAVAPSTPDLSSPAESPVAPAAPEARPRRRRAPPLSDNPEIAAAERLARIAVSDVILYNEEKFASAVAQGGDIVAAMGGEIEEARAHFNQRIPEEVRSQKDFLAEELRRRASA